MQMLENHIVRKSSVKENDQNQSTSSFVGPQSPIYVDRRKALDEFDQEVLASEEAIESTYDPRVNMLVANSQVLIKHQEIPLALNLLRQASNLDSKNIKVLKLLEKCLILRGADQEALIVSKNIAKIRPSYSSLNGYANALYKNGQDDLALENYFHALALLKNETSELFETYKNMGNIYVKNGDFEAAEEFYNKAYTVDPRNDVLLVNLGTLEVQRSDFDKALFCYRHAVEINGQNDKAWVGLAMVHNHFGDRELAWANLDSALDVNTSNRTAVHLAANWGLRDGKISKAIEILQDYLGEVEQDEEMSMILVNLCCTIGDLDLASLEMERILLWNPDNSEVKKLLKTINKNQRV